MKNGRYREAQNMAILEQAEVGVPVTQLRLWPVLFAIAQLSQIERRRTFCAF